MWSISFERNAASDEWAGDKGTIGLFIAGWCIFGLERFTSRYGFFYGIIFLNRSLRLIKEN